MTTINESRYIAGELVSKATFNEVSSMGIKGMSPDQPIIENERGGKQSATPYAFHLLPAKALLECAEVLQYGAIRYGAYNWKKIDVEDHVNHAAAHIYAHLAGDTTDRHLSHAVVRLMFALELVKEQQ